MKGRRYQQLLQQRAALVDEAKALLTAAETGGRALTADEQTRDDAIHAELTQIKAELSRWDRLHEEERTAPVAAPASAQVRDLAVEKPWRSLGEFLKGVHAAGIGAGIDPRLFRAAATGMGEAIGPDGGYAVPVEYAGGIEKEMWTQGEILSRVSARPVTGNNMTFNVINETARTAGNRRGGVLGYWVDEGVAPTASRPKLAQIEMKLRKVGCLGYMSDELTADAATLEAELRDSFTEELLFQAEDAIVNGVGTYQPLGILNAPCLISVTAETGQASATILTTNLSKMWVRLPSRSKSSAVWLVNGEVGPQLDELTIPAGTAAVEPRFVNYGPTGLLTIKGRPVVEVEYCAALGTVGDIILADLSQYRVINKTAGVELASSIHVLFTTGENTWRAFYRIDGQPLPRAAISPYKGSASLSPFVALASR